MDYIDLTTLEDDLAALHRAVRTVEDALSEVNRYTVRVRSRVTDLGEQLTHTERERDQLRAELDRLNAQR